MCGIAGIYDPGGEPSSALVSAMVEQLVHRGPDGDGFHQERDVALGMRRLAIIDPEHGHQPLYNERRDVVVVFNGEIYNHAELRRDLERKGHTLGSGSDGEILPHLYEEMGERFMEPLNGIFAIALWDRGTRTLHLVRDKLGVKPLYWSARGASVSFASELKALLKDSGIPRDLDYAAIDHFLTFRFVPAPLTPFQAVRKLLPGTALRVDASGVRERTYWTGEMTGHRRDRRQLVEEYQDAFERAVVRQMMSDVPIGVMLSGGVDSGAIAAVMAQHSSQVHTFTIGFAEGGDTNEVGLAEETAKLFGTDHHSVTVGADEYLRDLPASMLMVEEPIGTSSALALKYVADLMRPTVPVALCGQGADEPLGGYWRYLGIKVAQTVRPVAPIAGLARFVPRVGTNERLRRGVSTLRRGSDGELLLTAYRLLEEDDKRRLYAPALSEGLNGSPPEAAIERLRARVARLDPLAQMLYVDTRFWLPNELLLIADKMSMAASVELRVPFLDEDLIDLVESMHSSEKVRGLSRKSLHKQAMLKWLPRKIVYRRERGWATPVGDWFRGELRPLLTEVLLGEGELARQIFDERHLRHMIDTHAEGRANLTRQLFALLSLGLWHRGFAASPSPPAVQAGGI